MTTLDEEIKREEEMADCCEYDASKLDLYDRYENFLAGEYGKCAEECRQRAEWFKELKRLREQDINAILDNIKEEIKAKIEQEDFARSVFIHEEKDTTKANQCTGSIMAYNNVIKLIDRKKVSDKQ